MKRLTVFFRGLRLFLLLFIMVGIVGGLYLISTQRLGTLTKAAPEAPTVRLFFEADTELARGREFSLLLKLDPRGAAVRGFEVYVSYDPQKAEPAGNFLDDLEQAYDADKGFFKKISPDKEKHIVQVYGAKIGGEPISGAETVELANLKFKVKGEVGETDEIPFQWTDETKIVGEDSALNVSLDEGLFVLGTKEPKKREVKVESAVPTVVTTLPPELVVEPTVYTVPTRAVEPTKPQAAPTKPAPPKTTPTATPTGPAGQTLTVKLLLTFQGVTAPPPGADPVPVAVTVDGGGLTAAITQSVLFTPQKDGVWSGSLSLVNVAPGAGYKIHTKGPRHVGKTFGQITLGAGATLDFTETPQPVGDLSASGNRQDGVVNAADTSFVRNHILTADPAVIAAADANFDGAVNVVDYALILKTLERGIKKDEAL